MNNPDNYMYRCSQEGHNWTTLHVTVGLTTTMTCTKASSHTDRLLVKLRVTSCNNHYSMQKQLNSHLHDIQSNY